MLLNPYVCSAIKKRAKDPRRRHGMQARRTGTSSPLGELFDHGCDAWATVFICGTFYSVFGRDYDGYRDPMIQLEY